MDWYFKIIAYFQHSGLLVANLVMRTQQFIEVKIYVWAFP